MIERDQQLAALAVLAEPLRRRLYLHVTSQPSPQSRDAAAAALGVTRSAAAFHLDKLAEVGLLEVEYRRPPGRAGPGAGRPSKLYRRTGPDASFSLPARRYDVAASLMARALQEVCERGLPADEALKAVAHDYGRAIGGELRASPSAPGALLERIAEVLSAHGYEPRLTGRVMTLENCPFGSLTAAHRQLVCAMNHEIMTGLLEAVGTPGSSTRVDTTPGHCCVTLVAS